jgi:hypothetical protein
MRIESFGTRNCERDRGIKTAAKQNNGRLSHDASYIAPTLATVEKNA